MGLLLAVLAGCGEFCLFCDGNSGWNGNGGAENVCDRVFPGLATYQSALNARMIDDFTEAREGNDRLSIALVPTGMSFNYGTPSRTAKPGDVIAADARAGRIYVYEYGSPSRRVLLSGFAEISGLALLHREIAANFSLDLLFFTVRTANSLYMYNLSLPSSSSNPIQITNAILGSNFLQSPTALTVSADSQRAVLFVVNDNGQNSRVGRLYVDLVTWAPTSPRILGTMTEANRRLIDMAYFDHTDTLYISKKVVEGEGMGGSVYQIVNASERTGSVNLSADSSFIRQFRSLTGLAVARTNRQGTSAALLVLSEIEGSVEQFDILRGGDPEDVFFFGELSQFPQAIAYDCTHGRLLVTDVPFNPDFPRTLFQALPTPP